MGNMVEVVRNVRIDHHHEFFAWRSLRATVLTGELVRSISYLTQTRTRTYFFQSYPPPEASLKDFFGNKNTPNRRVSDLYI